MSRRPPASVAVLALAAVVSLAACGSSGGGATASPAPSPAASPSSPASPTPADAITHATGVTDVVLRVAIESGFVRMETVMGRVPLFTLYGDGRVLVVPEDPGIEPVRGPVLRETRLTEDEVQRLLRYALVDGQLGIAHQDYPAMVMDAPSTVFTIHTGDVDKRVVVNALSSDPAPGPDAAAYRAFASLLARLQAIPTAADFQAEQSVAILAETEHAPGVATAPWPWPDLSPGDFVQPAEGDPVPFPRHLLSTAQATAAGSDPSTGAAVLNLDGPDGRTYVVVIRPALPDETAAPG